MHPSTRLLMAAMVPLLLAIAVAPFVLPAGNICESCHAPGNPSGNYIFAPPQVSLSSPAVSQPNESLVVELAVHHTGKYSINALAATLSLEGPGSLASAESASKTLPEMALPGTCGLNWTVLAGSEGFLRINATIEYTAHFKHTNTQGSDDYTYRVVRSCSVVVRPVALRLSPAELSFRAGKGSCAAFELVAAFNVSNITVRISSNLAGLATATTTGIARMAAGERQSVKVSFGGGSLAINNGRIDVMWENATGVEDSAFVAIRVIQPAPATPSTPIPLMGRATGIVSLALLITSIVIGLVKMGKARRARVHCAVSWFILGLSVYHGLILLLGPYSTLTLGTYVILGYASAAVMGVASVNGLINKWMSKKLGYKGWLWIHRIGTIVAITLVVIHAIMMGTDTAFIRNLFM